MHPAELLAAERFAPAPWQHLMLQIASDGAAAYLHTPDECFAIELSTGALRWRSAEGFAALRRPVRAEAFAGLPETMTTVLDGRVYARALHHGAAGAVYAIDSRDARSGTLAWSSEAGEATSDASAVSSPACSEGVVVAVFQDVQERSRSFAAAFAAKDGRLLWRTQLAFGLASLTLSSQQEIYLGDHLAAPSISGGDVYISTDMGSVVDLELSSGMVRWAATYPRALLDPVAGAEIVRQLADRAASRVVVGPELVYVAPRDTLAVMAISRANGSVRWRQELSDARALVGLAGEAPQAALISQGRGLTALAAASGEERWHWSPSGDDQLWGAAAIGARSIYVPTASVLARIDPRDGRSQGQQAWSELGLDRPIGNLVLLNDLVLGVGKDRLVCLQGGQAAKLQVEVPPRQSAAHLAPTGLPGAAFAPPLAFRWRLASGPAAAMLHPTGANPAELYLGLDDRLLRLDADGARILWDAPVPPGMLRAEVIQGMLLATYPRSLVAIDNASGRLLWTRALSYDDAGFFLDTENRGERRLAEAVATPAVVATGGRARARSRSSTPAPARSSRASPSPASCTGWASPATRSWACRPGATAAGSRAGSLPPARSAGPRTWRCARSGSGASPPPSRSTAPPPTSPSRPTWSRSTSLRARCSTTSLSSSARGRPWNATAPPWSRPAGAATATAARRSTRRPARPSSTSNSTMAGASRRCSPTASPAIARSASANSASTATRPRSAAPAPTPRSCGPPTSATSGTTAASAPRWSAACWW